MAGCPERITATPQKRGHCDAKIKRLEAGSFQVPDAGGRDGIELRPAQLAMILSGIDLGSVHRQRRYSRETVESPR
jgi:hypothetical protein